MHPPPSLPSLSLPDVSLQARGLACERGGRTLFQGVDLDLGPGDLFALTGPNGAGKSTLLRMIAGLTPLEAGALTLLGGDPDAEVGHAIQYHGHREGLRDALTARENLTFATALLGGDTARIPAALAQLEATRLAELPVRVLSAGQRRRIALCRLLTTPRPIWLLDEPLAALDRTGQALVDTLIADHCAAGGSAIVATHQPLGIAARPLELGVRA